jgi:chemosensory pili system protein ChpC
MAHQAPGRIHTLEIPVSQFSLLVPSANVAEVINVGDITPIPFTQTWVLGAVGWRHLGVPVVSFESLLGLVQQDPQAHSKLVVFYPLRGRREWEFFSLLSTSEPRPHAVDDNLVLPASASDLPDSPFIAAGLRVEERVMLIPDIDRLRRAFYLS